MAKQTKTTKKVVKKTEVKPAPVMEKTCSCGKDCPCGCHKHGAAHMLKHVIIFAIIFALGLVCGKMMSCGDAHKKMPQRMHPVFTNGCLDMQSVENSKMLEALKKADVNADECISIEEYRAVRKEMRPMNKKMQKPFNKQMFKGKKSK